MPVRLCVTLIIALALNASPALAGIFSDDPDIIVCEQGATADRPGGLIAYYVDGRFEDGTIIYKTLTARLTVLRVDPDGVVHVENIPSCNGKTVSELRGAGRAFDFR